MCGASSASFPPVQRMIFGFGFVSVRNGLQAMAPVKSFVASWLGGAVSLVKNASVRAPPCVIVVAHGHTSHQ